MTTLPHCPSVWRSAGLFSCLMIIGELAVSAPLGESSESLSAPMASRNLSPIYANLGIPAMNSAFALEQGTWTADWTLHWASHSVLEQNNDLTLAFDGETRRQDFRIQLGLGKGVVASLNVPYISHSGGNLDGLIDDWHAFWGMPDGPRAVQPEDRLRFTYSAPSGFDMQSNRSGLGDVELALQLQVAASEHWALAVFGQYKFATGESRDFTGSGEAGASLGARWSRGYCGFSQLSCHLQAGISEVGDSAFDENSETLTPFVGLSLAWQLGDSLAILGQIDAHDVIYASDVLAENGTPVWGTLGLRWRPAERWSFEAQFIEDLAVGSAPDVTFRFSLAHAF